MQESKGELCLFLTNRRKQRLPLREVKKTPQRPKRTLRASIDEYILDHKSQNHSPKTIEWHNIAWGNLAALYINIKPSPLDKGLKQAVHLLK
ncbi:MAG: hypothetical protein NVS4B11_24820 [Ktedonobacteraceae bacterium]